MTWAGHDGALRLSVALVMLAAMAAWELAAPARRAEMPRLLRWSNNLGMVALDAALVRLLVPLSLSAFAASVQARGWGMFALTPLPGWAEAVLALVLLDLAIWAQHRAFHHVPLLWRLHRVHHSDPDIDASTGLRFHPVEILLSVGCKMAVIAALGAPPGAVLAFEVILNGLSLFNHANIRLPARVDRLLRLVVVTPDMHRVHHSEIRAETDSNFGFNLPWWDRLFGTYRDQPALGHQGMTPGIGAFRSARDLWLDRLLLQPLRDLPKAAPHQDGNQAADPDGPPGP
jgi:sterol desaturase/sphingolipid hydroxylase (fatty acid hydroxylase superfamily)